MKQIFPFSVNHPTPRIKNVDVTTKYGYIDNGREILDLCLGGGCFPLGFKRTDIVDYVYSKIKEISFCSGDFSTSSSDVDYLSEKLYNLSGGYYSFYSLSGSDAIESAVKFVEIYHKKNKNKNKIISFTNSYHGSTYMAASIGGGSTLWEQFGKREDIIHIDYDDIEKYINHTIKAVFIETTSWTNELRPFTKEYFSKLRKLCDTYDVLLVIDDIAMCGGKTGTTFGFEVFDVKPDIFCLAKGITGGYFPLSITMINEKVSKIIKPQPFLHGFTYNPSISGIYSTTKYLQILEEENILQKHQSVIDCGKNVMSNLLQKGLIKSYRQFGTLYNIIPTVAIENKINRIEKYYDAKMHCGMWNGSSDNTLIMTPIVPDGEYFETLEARLTGVLTTP
jgi:adenosylmethionine-8-amino-7-oxononanoate aminotransferase